MKILAFDVSKRATGVAFHDDNGLDPDSLQTVEFIDTSQWRRIIVQLIDKWNPDVIVYSDTANKFNSINVLRWMLGLFFYLEAIAHDCGVDVIKTTDGEAKKYTGCNGKNRKEKKARTIQWVKDVYKIEPTEDECDAIVFASYIHSLLIKKEIDRED